MAICKDECYLTQISLCGGRNFYELFVLWYNFDCRYARKPMKHSTDSDDTPVSQKTWLI